MYGGLGGVMASAQPPPPVWMPKPATGAPNCPPGLEYLTQIDQILIKQKIELMELFTNWEAKNKYRILNTLGQQVYFAKEVNLLKFDYVGSYKLMETFNNAFLELTRPAARRCASRPHIEVPEGETLTGRRNQDYIDVASERLYVGASGDEFSLIDNNIRPQFVAENLMSYLLY
ncbi:phospholipid scramblase 2-like [Ruditapes philippinarum]|uniref:phospholipid scramblase 2-like n=1 Tax=Ruditapes philippinarum TaxID=129788 RepID=UPI00295B6D84|nr:phospholipid scramblase 2-like [Ruditapes philippinarum]